MNLKEMEQELRDKSNNIINDLSKEEVEKYIQVLTKKYYEYYLSGNSKKFNDNFKELKTIVEIFEGSIDESEVSEINMLDERIFEYDLKLLKTILEGND